MKDLIAKLVGLAIEWGKGSWLKGLIVAIALGALGGGVAYVAPGVWNDVKPVIELPQPAE